MRLDNFSCAPAVNWQGTTYVGTRVQRAVRLARTLGEGNLQACNDGGGSTPQRSVKLAAIEGVPSDQAVAVAGDRSTVYVEPRYFPQVAHTSLHDLIFGPGVKVRNERSQCGRGHTTTADVRGVILDASFGVLNVTLLDPGTRGQVLQCHMFIVTALRPRNKNVPAASRVDRLVQSRCVDLAVQDLTPSP